VVVVVVVCCGRNSLAGDGPARSLVGSGWNLSGSGFADVAPIGAGVVG